MPKIVDYDQRRSEIVDVTWNLIIDGGIEAATMREIARSAGYANGALKLYFPSKDLIVEATFQRALELMYGKVRDAVGDRRGLEALRISCREAMPIDDERVNASRVLLAFWAMSLSHERLRQAYTKHLVTWREGLHEYLRQGREDGQIVTPTPDEELVDELVLINAGANAMVVVGPEYTTTELQLAHLDAFFARLRRRR